MFTESGAVARRLWATLTAKLTENTAYKEAPNGIYRNNSWVAHGVACGRITPVFLDHVPPEGFEFLISPG